MRVIALFVRDAVIVQGRRLLSIRIWIVICLSVVFVDAAIAQIVAGIVIFWAEFAQNWGMWLIKVWHSDVRVVVTINRILYRGAAGECSRCSKLMDAGYRAGKRPAKR